MAHVIKHKADVRAEPCVRTWKCFGQLQAEATSHDALLDNWASISTGLAPSADMLDIKACASQASILVKTYVGRSSGAEGIALTGTRHPSRQGTRAR